MKPFEATLLKALFPSGDTTLLSDLENKFYTTLADLQKQIYDGLVRRGCWLYRPDHVKAYWWAGAGILFFFGAFGVAGARDGSGILFLAVLLSAVILFAFSWFMPRRTLRGARLAEKVAGLQEFLRRTNEDRLKRETGPAALFERMLPYAMALGVANQWAKAFEGIYQVAPAWFTSYSGGSFTPGDFTRRLGAASDRMGSAMASVPRSRGGSAMASTPRSSGGSGFSGGFSGGGGGGGGGGSW